MYFPHTNLFKCSVNGNQWKTKFCAPIAVQQLGQESFQSSPNHWSFISVLPWTNQSPGQKCPVLCSTLTISVNTEALHDLISHLSVQKLRILFTTIPLLCKNSHFEQIPRVALLFPALISSHSQLCVHVLGPAPSAQQHSCLTICWHIPGIYGKARFVRIKKKRFMMGC